MSLIDLPQTYLRMGKRTVTAVIPAEEIAPDRETFPNANYGMMLLWSQEYPWLKFKVQHRNQVWVDGVQGNLDYDRICATVGTTAARLTPKRPSYIKASLIERGLPLEVVVEFDTSSRQLREYVRKHRQTEPQSRELKFRTQLVAFDFRNQEHTHKFDLDILVAPLDPLPHFDGYVAIDLGNFSTEISCLAAGRVTSRDILMLDAQDVNPKLLPQSRTTESLVRIDEINTWYPTQEASRQSNARVYPDQQHPSDDLPPSCTWVTGRIAREGKLSRQLAGAKRMLTRDTSAASIAIPVTHRRVFLQERSSQVAEEFVQLRNHIPAELLLARMIEKFMLAVRFNDNQPAGWPRYLAVTYPTSYTPREIQAVRTVLHRAWLRANYEYQTGVVDLTPDQAEAQFDRDAAMSKIADKLRQKIDPERKVSIGEASTNEDPCVRLMIDEATAASFYYLFRFAAESPGGLTAFRYQYPEGMNLLLYDCGGGTTDIALVQARVTSGTLNEITLKVLGRSGVRYFGGDDITWAICRLLKAKIAALAMKEKSDRAIPPIKLTPLDSTKPGAHLHANGEEVRRFLEAVQSSGPANKYVPTEFDPTDASVHTEDARECAQILWGWGEELKRRIGQPDKTGAETRIVSLGLFEAEGSFNRNTSRLHTAILNATFGPTASGSGVKDFGNKILKIEIHRDEIDAMIARSVVRSLACCRSLIEQKLPGNPDQVAPVVHKVAVTGNASRYPLIREMLKNRLQVSDLEPEHWFHYEERELKSAVAKGAVQALAAMSGIGINRFRFDTRMSECLPFDVAYRDFRRNDFPLLYAQQSRYEELQPATIAIVDADNTREFTLYKRFPGDGDSLDREDDKLFGFDSTDDESLKRNRGYTELETWQFDEPISGSINVHYDIDLHEFKILDANRNEGKKIPKRDDDIRSRAPHQRGTL